VTSRHPRLRSPIGRRSLAFVAAGIVLLACLPTVVAVNEVGPGGTAPWVASEALEGEPTGHLLVSEVMTGGASASDEFIELYNPGPEALPLEGLEVIYVTASGGTITRKASWTTGSQPVAAGTHVLIANAAGIFAGVADVTYTNGLAATGGSVAIRIIGASLAIDAAGWGNATSSWLEGLPAPAPAAGQSLERLPGGELGSGQDSDQNSVDFVQRATPDPQNTLSPPIPVATPQPSQSPSGTPPASPTPSSSVSASPSPTASVTPEATPEPTPSSTPLPSATPSPAPLSIADARALPDGSSVTVAGTTLSDSAFTEGGGYLADATGGIAILLADGSFARGLEVTVIGILDDRFSQRTIRTDAGGVTIIGPAAEPAAQAVSTGAVGESLEGELVEVAGSIVSAPTQLTSGIALDLDDGSGIVRVLVGSTTGIATTGWARGAVLQLRGVVGQRDSSGSGTTGYRVQPRDSGDVISFQPPATPTPVPSGSSSPSPTPSGGPTLMSIAAARAASFNARVAVRGIVTLPSDMAEEGTAAIQDSSGAILLRLGDEAGSLELGELIEISGTRSTKAGMETIRVVEPPRRLGHQSQPDARRGETGSLGEADEARLVIVRGAVTLSPRRTSAQNVYFDIDDGSGPIRVFVSPRSAARSDAVVLGSWVEMRGVLGQETTGSLPERGYRIWPRLASDLEIVAPATGTGTPVDGASPASGGSTTDGGGVGAAGGVSAPASSTPAEQQGLPRLARAAATASLSPMLPQTAAPGAEDPDPAPMAAGGALLAMGGLLLGGAGLLVAPPGRPGQLLRALRERLAPKQDPEDGDLPSPPVESLPTLLPLTVLDGASGASAERAPRAPRSGERILPPT